MGFTAPLALSSMAGVLAYCFDSIVLADSSR